MPHAAASLQKQRRHNIAPGTLASFVTHCPKPKFVTGIIFIKNGATVEGKFTIQGKKLYSILTIRLWLLGLE